MPEVTGKMLYVLLLIIQPRKKLEQKLQVHVATVGRKIVIKNFQHKLSVSNGTKSLREVKKEDVCQNSTV